MKNRQLKYLLIILLLSLSYPVKAQSQHSIQLDYANTLFSTRQYFDSITEYKRLLFYDSSNAYSYTANFQIGKCYKAGAKFDDAIKYFSLAELNANSDEEIYSSKIEIVRSNILRKTTSRALQILDELEKKYSDKEKIDSLNYWRGWTYIFTDDWKKASEHFAKINYYNELKILCDRVEKEKVSVTFATVISYILPGAGQIYTGNIFSGFLSLGWNVLSGYLTLNAFNADRVFDGMAILTLLWQRFYRGNVQNAERFALEKNIDVANKTLNYLQKEYRGTKP
ncbi:MAG: hypothetical protein RDU14_10650 [Melioribacteraceae bacterium]|nr:hypothetical protein [Melioribacteraceae bacterium]